MCSKGIAIASTRKGLPSTVHQLRDALAFHQRVQTAFAAGLTGADAAAERTISLYRGRSGRVDLVIVPQQAERSAVVVEVKNTDWDKLGTSRVRPNLRSHIRQLQHYLDPLIDGLDPRSERPQSAGLLAGPWDSVSGLLLYPRRPREATRAQLIEDLVSKQALDVIWYDEMDWAD